MSSVGFVLRSAGRASRNPAIFCRNPYFSVTVSVSPSVRKVVQRQFAQIDFMSPRILSRELSSSAKPLQAENQNGLTDEEKKDLQKKLSDADFQHFRTATKKNEGVKTEQLHWNLPHPIWSEEERLKVKITHREPKGFVDKAAYKSVQALRKSFDVLSGYKRGKPSEKKWLVRIIFLETVAGVPGMVAAMVRHLNSLRRMKRDHGWIHTLLEEAENERMHLMTALQVRKPSFLFRWTVLGAQGVFVSAFSVAYLLSPSFCHRFVGYLEEEAVITYTKCLQDIDNGLLPAWSNMPAPPLAIQYWKLPEDAMMRDVIEVIRADEAHHRVVNHTLGSLDKDAKNPYGPGQ